MFTCICMYMVAMKERWRDRLFRTASFFFLPFLDMKYNFNHVLKKKKGMTAG